jgi:hypothetical protein
MPNLSGGSCGEKRHDEENFPETGSNHIVDAGGRA